MILGTFFIALLVGSFSIFANIAVYRGLRRRNVAIRFLWSGTPGYLLRLCAHLPPSPENARLTRLAKWADIALVLAFTIAAITGPLLGHASK